MLVAVFLFGLLATGIVAIGLMFAFAAFSAAEEEYGAEAPSERRAEPPV